MISEQRGRYHADPLFAKYGILKIGDLYKQQLRVHAWQFWNDSLPENQSSIYQRVTEIHNHATRAAGSGIGRMARDKGSLGYRVPKEWAQLPEELKKLKSKAAFKRLSKRQLIQQYKDFICHQIDCGVCGNVGGNAASQIGQEN